MKKILYIFAILLASVIAKAQYVPVGNGLQRQIVGTDTTYRFSLAPGFMYPATRYWVSQQLGGLSGNYVTTNTDQPNIYGDKLWHDVQEYNSIARFYAGLNIGMSGITWINNPVGLLGNLTSYTLTANRDWKLRDKTGDIAFTNDTTIFRSTANSLSLSQLQTKLSNYVDLTTAQSIGGNKNFLGNTSFVNPITINGGNLTWDAGVNRFAGGTGGSFTSFAYVTDLITGKTIGANTTGSAAKLTNTRAIGITGLSAVPANFDGSSNVDINVTGVPTSLLTGIVASTNGGAGTVNGILKANGSGTVSQAVAGTDYVAPSALASYELLSNKSTSTSLGTSNTLYPTQNAVKTYVDTKFAAVPIPTLQQVTTAGNTTTTGATFGGTLKNNIGSDAIDIGLPTGNSYRSNILLRSSDNTGVVINQYVGANIYNTNSNLELKNNGNNGIDITMSGNVGIGTSNPVTTLHVNSGNTISAFIGTTGNNGIALGSASTTDANIQAVASDLTTNKLLNINASGGNVSIATTGATTTVNGKLVASLAPVASNEVVRLGDLANWAQNSVNVGTASSYTITTGGIFRFNGTTSTFTLPPVSGNAGKMIFIANRGSGNITLNSNSGANDIYSGGSLLSTTTINPTGTSKLINDGVNWVFY